MKRQLGETSKGRWVIDCFPHRHSPAVARTRNDELFFICMSHASQDNSHLAKTSQDISQSSACLSNTQIMSVTLHTSHGDLKLELFCSAVPKTAYNFLALCASSYYVSSNFHRSIPEFMIQGGSDDPTGKGKGGSSIWLEDFEDEIKPALRHNARGIVSMANKGPATNGSQFFICYKAAPHLDGKNTVFAKVIEGEDTTLDTMEAVPVDKKNRPLEPIKIERITIHANPLADQPPP